VTSNKGEVTGSNPVIATNGTVVQSAEAMVLKASQCGFESHQCYNSLGQACHGTSPRFGTGAKYVSDRVAEGDGLQNHLRKHTWVRILPGVQ
jgi:hypothetical protein